jgi:hypothetical protein
VIEEPTAEGTIESASNSHPGMISCECVSVALTLAEEAITGGSADNRYEDSSGDRGDAIITTIDLQLAAVLSDDVLEV